MTTSIAQISDLHIKRSGELAYGRVDTAVALARCVAELNRLTPRPELVVISGDLADTPSDAEYAHVKSLLARLEIPFVAVPGNHDDRQLMRAAFQAQPYAHKDGPLDLIHAAGGLDILLLDSSVPGKPFGLLESRTLAWLDERLGASAGRPALLFLHHPPFVTGIKHMDVQNLHNAGELAMLLRKHRRVRLVAAGHVHRATLTMFADIPATICPAPNHAVALDLDGRLPPSLVIEPSAFHLHVWLQGEGYGELVTHHVPIGDFPGPYPFFGNDGRLL